MNPGKNGNEGEALLGAIAIVTAFVAMTLTVYSVNSAVQHTHIRLPFENQVFVRLWFPQGWKFFTRNPREVHRDVYLRDATGAWKPVSDTLMNTSAANLLGLDRKNRALNVELARLMEGIPNAGWFKTKGDPIAALDKCAVIKTVRNETPQPRICGTVGIVEQPPLPWAWFRDGIKAVMPSRVVKLEVQCF
jgi:antimicrobial peptide system SdpA family protein